MGRRPDDLVARRTVICGTALFDRRRDRSGNALTRGIRREGLNKRISWPRTEAKPRYPVIQGFLTLPLPRPWTLRGTPASPRGRGRVQEIRPPGLCERSEWPDQDARTSRFRGSTAPSGPEGPEGLFIGYNDV